MKPDSSFVGEVEAAALFAAMAALIEADMD